MYNDNLLFLHIPKCGGTALGGLHRGGEYEPGWLNQQIPDLLPRDLPIGHMPLSAMERHTGRHPLSFQHIIAVIRDPYEQQFSQWKFWKHRYTMGQRHQCDRIATRTSFENFVAHPASDHRFLVSGLDMVEVTGLSVQQAGGLFRWWLQVGNVIPDNLVLFKLEEIDRLQAWLGNYLGRELPPVRHYYSTHSDRKIEDHLTAKAAKIIEGKFAWTFTTRKYRKRKIATPDTELTPA